MFKGLNDRYKAILFTSDGLILISSVPQLLLTSAMLLVLNMRAVKFRQQRGTSRYLTAYVYSLALCAIYSGQ